VDGVDLCRRDELSDGEFGIDRAPGTDSSVCRPSRPSRGGRGFVSVACAVSIKSSVSVSDHASPAERTEDLVFLARGRVRENALLNELFSWHTTHTFRH